LRLVGNILWFVLHGLWAFLAYLSAGIGFCLTIFGIPLGIASFRFAFFVVWPFGRKCVDSGSPGVLTFIGNVFWFLLGGWWLVVIHLVGAALLCLTIVGIPFGVQAFKLAGFAIAPLGKQIVRG
jgi:uncharacterized membrane protein YccF (DUF307 family)